MVSATTLKVAMSPFIDGKTGNDAEAGSGRVL